MNVLQQIAKTMGATYLSFDADLCRVEGIGVTIKLAWHDNIVGCDHEDHITKM